MPPPPGGRNKAIQADSTDRTPMIMTAATTLRALSIRLPFGQGADLLVRFAAGDEIGGEARLVTVPFPIDRADESRQRVVKRRGAKAVQIFAVRRAEAQ